jgi:hypothetical protein
MFAAEQNWAGEYADKRFLNGKAVFEMSVEESGNRIQVSFDAVYNDGHGCAPEAVGPAKVLDKNTLTFTFRDSSNNAGTGTIKRAGEDLIVSIKPTRVADPRCLVFYQENFRLKLASKKPQH